LMNSVTSFHTFQRDFGSRINLVAKRRSAGKAGLISGIFFLINSLLFSVFGLLILGFSIYVIYYSFEGNYTTGKDGLFLLIAILLGVIVSIVLVVELLSIVISIGHILGSSLIIRGKRYKLSVGLTITSLVFLLINAPLMLIIWIVAFILTVEFSLVYLALGTVWSLLFLAGFLVTLYCIVRTFKLKLSFDS
jgi:hypothetical protein